MALASGPLASAQILCSMDFSFPDFGGRVQRVPSVERYLLVAEDVRAAKFFVAQRVGADFDPSAESAELLELHSEVVARAEAFVGERPGLGRVEDMETAEPSLMDLKAELARRHLQSCAFCHNRCGADRASGESGTCGVGSEMELSSEFIHLGEEPELVPSHTVFFGGCTSRCVYCQNYRIARGLESFSSPSAEDLADRVRLKRMNGSRNVNWVGGDPTPLLHHVLEVLSILDVNVPSVWNSNMYLSEEGMELLRGTQDLYLTDFKYGNDDCAYRLSEVGDYTEVVERNHRLASREADMIIRHLVLPEHLECCTRPILDWIARELGRDTRVNLMFQYRPEHQASRHDELSRPLNREERARAKELAEGAGLTNLV